MDALLFRTRVAVLWLAVAIAALGSLLLHLFIPGALEEMVAGEMEGETLTDGLTFFFGALGTIPVAMAAVALLVSDRVNRWVNLIAGLAFGLFGVFAVVGHLVDGGLNVHVLMVAVASIGAFLIAGLSLVGLRRPTSEPAAPASEPSRNHEATTRLAR
jgi:hypothetical protein